MKKINVFTFFVILLLSFNLGFAQTEETQTPKKNKDTTKINLKNMQIIMIQKKATDVENTAENPADQDEIQNLNTAPAKKKKSKKSGADVGFLHIDLGLNLLTNDGNPKPTAQIEDLKLKTWRSWSTTLNFLPTKIYLGSKNIQLRTAFAWRIGEYEFTNKLNFTPNKTLEYTKDEKVNGSEIKKSEFDFHYLQIPLMVYVQSNKIKGLGRIGIGLGGYAGILTHQEHEIKTTNSDRNIETEEDFGFNQYRYGLSTKIDFGPFKVFGNLDLNSAWKNTDYKNVECGVWFDF